MESPLGQEFGTAALALASKFRMDPASDLGRKAAGKRVGIPVMFGNPAAGPPRRAAAFKTPSSQYAWLAPAGPYWPDRATREGKGGFAVVDCRVEGDSRLKDCTVVDYSQPNMGFADATLKMAEQGWMTAGPPPSNASSPEDGVWRFEVDFPARSMFRAARR